MIKFLASTLPPRSRNAYSMTQFKLSLIKLYISKIAEMESTQTDVINYEQFHLDISLCIKSMIDTKNFTE